MSDKTIAFRVSEDFHSEIKYRLVEKKMTLKDYIVDLIKKDISGKNEANQITEQDVIAHAKEIAEVLNKKK